MDDLDVLARDFGLRPQGKSNPMRSDGEDRRSASVRSSSSPFYDDHSNRDGFLFNDVFGGPPKYTSSSNNNKKSSSIGEFDYDSIFKSSASATDDARSYNNNNSKSSSSPVYDKPVYDDDIFDGLPGIKSKSVPSGKFEEDVFASMASPPRKSLNNKGNINNNDQFDDLLGKLGRNEKNNSKSSSAAVFDDLLGNLGRNERMADGDRSSKNSSSRGFDDLLGGFGTGSPASGDSHVPHRSASESSHGPRPASTFVQPASNTVDDPFVVLESTSQPGSSSQGVFTDPLEDVGKLGKSGSTKIDASSVSGGVFDDLDPLSSFSKSANPFSSEKSNRAKDGSPSRPGRGMSKTQVSSSRDQAGKSSRYSESHLQRKVPNDSFQESSIFDMPTTDSLKSFHQNASSPSHVSANVNETSSQADMSPRSEENVQPSDDIWLTVSEVPLFTQPTEAPPPARAPPSIPRQRSQSEGVFFSTNNRKMGDGFSPSSYSSYSQSPQPVHTMGNGTPVSQIDELEDFAMGRTQSSIEEPNIHSAEEMNVSSVAASAAAMKEAMDKFRHAKEVREREYARAARTKEAVHVEKDDRADAQEREFRENQERLEREQRQREEQEREQRRLERERERERLRDIEREKARQAVERATREARERAAADARERAAAEARLKAERAAVGKAQAEARERAERAAVQRAQAEARERAANEARERAEKAASDARERVNAEARELREKAAVDRAAEVRRRAERAAVERAAAEARERAAAEARERAAAAAAARASQQRNDNDVESFFNMGSRPSSAPRPRASSDNVFDTQFQSTAGPQMASSVGSSSNMRKASSATNIVDDLSSIFGAAPSAGEFQEVEGETEERRRARFERQQRTQERAAKALAEKNQRDLQAQREQEERHRIAESLDFEIKRWAAGKEGNLRALLATLQYVLWPECGWQPVSLTDLITGASVKKVYRKATLCIHPDKVQQKGATLQQKYIAEKVFDLLKEAWNKFNSEELF